MLAAASAPRASDLRRDPGAPLLSRRAGLRATTFVPVLLWLLAAPVGAQEPAGSAAATAAADAAGEGAGAGCASYLTGDDLPDPARLEREGARVRRILVHADDIFDPEKPGEDFWAFRLANDLHLSTRPEVIRRRLVFASGEPFRASRLAESERLLRRERFLYDASVRPVAWCDGQVDVEVTTRDVWSLKPRFHFSRKGGTNAWKVGMQDSNFLGRGIDLTLSRESDVDRTSTLARYRDTDFLARRLRLELWYSDNSDGEFARFELGRPFYSLDTRTAAGGRFLRDRRIDARYELGHVIDRYSVAQNFAELSFGRSRGVRDGRVARFRFGASLDERTISALPGEPLARALPGNQRFVYPWVAGEWLEDGYIEAQNLDKIDRTEDFNLGRRVTLWVGAATETLGSDRDAALFGGGWTDGYSRRAGQMLFVGVSASGRYEQGGLRDTVGSLGAKLYLRDFGAHLFFATLSIDAAHRLDPARQLLLGGDNGLRGYPLRYQEGNRRVLLTLEQRFYHRRELFHLLRLGGAVFFDVGKAWTVGEPGPPSLGVLSDVGVGLRIGSSRSADAAMVHLDVALPLDSHDGQRGVQWLVTTSETF